MSRLTNNPNLNQKKGGETMYNLQETQRIIMANPYTCNYNKEEQDEILQSTDNTRKFIITSKLNTEDYQTRAIEYNITEIPYTLTYQQHNILKQAAYQIMQKHNNRIYNSNNKNKTYLKYNQTVAILYKTKNKEQLLDIIEQFTEAKQKQQNQKLIDHNQSQIIIPKLQNLTDTQVKQLANELQNLEELYYLELDINYTDKQSIITNYQQVIAYKKAGIQLEPREIEEEPYYEEQSYDLQDLIEEYPDLKIWNPEERSN